MMNEEKTHENCSKRYSDKIIDELSRDVIEVKECLKEVKECLIGSLEKQGWISRFSERINKVEDNQRSQGWLIAILVSVVLAGSFKVFFSK